MAIDWKRVRPQVQRLQAQGKSVTDIATELGIDRKVLTSKIYREENKQTQPPESDELGGTDPIQEEKEPAENSVPKLVPLGAELPWEDDTITQYNEQIKQGGFTAADEEEPPYAATFSEHHKIALEIAELLDRKRADYGTENIRKFGSHGVLVRVSDKVERLINLSKRNNKPNFESVEDIWRDIAGYAILALIELREGR